MCTCLFVLTSYRWGQTHALLTTEIKNITTPLSCTVTLRSDNEGAEMVSTAIEYTKMRKERQQHRNRANRLAGQALPLSRCTLLSTLGATWSARPSGASDQTSLRVWQAPNRRRARGRRPRDDGNVEPNEVALELARAQVLQTTVAHVLLLVREACLCASDVGGGQTRREDELGRV
jgi:hypothetical protein